MGIRIKPSWIVRFRVHTPCNALHRLHAARLCPVLLPVPCLPSPPLYPLPSLSLQSPATLFAHTTRPSASRGQNSTATSLYQQKRHIHHHFHHTLPNGPLPPTLLSPTVLRQFRH